MEKEGKMLINKEQNQVYMIPNIRGSIQNVA